MRRINLAVILLFGMSCFAHADAYDRMLHRYEKEIRRQEKQLSSLKARLDEKQREANRWQQKAEESKSQWSQAASSVDKARAKAQNVQEQLNKTRALADAAESSATETALVAHSADEELRYMAREIYARRLMNDSSQPLLATRYQEIMADRLCGLSTTSHQQAAVAEHQEAVLRSEELQSQSQLQQRMAEVDQWRQRQQGYWLKWQEAQRRRESLELEKEQTEQSEQALEVMLQDLRNHRDRAMAAHVGKSANDPELAALRGTLPWPAYGKITQNFGRQYSSDLNQLLVSNGIRIEAGANRPVRAIQSGKVLFASAFRQYGPMVIIQHKSGLTSVYAGLGQTQVKEGMQIGTLDALGTTGDSGSFYFELRHDEQPVNPLAYLAPQHRSDLSLRRMIQ